MADEQNKGPDNNSNENFKKKLNETIETIKQNSNVDRVIDFAKTNTQDFIAYLVLLIGFILLFFIPFQGYLLVGLVLGYFFHVEIVGLYPFIKKFIDLEGYVRSITLCVTAVALFIAAPALFIGTAVMVALRTFFSDHQSS